MRHFEILMCKAVEQHLLVIFFSNLSQIGTAGVRRKNKRLSGLNGHFEGDIDYFFDAYKNQRVGA